MANSTISPYHPASYGLPSPGHRALQHGDAAYEVMSRLAAEAIRMGEQGFHLALPAPDTADEPADYSDIALDDGEGSDGDE
jgi:hypothetical protein